MVLVGVVLIYLVSKFGGSRGQIVAGYVLRCVALYPVEANFHGFGAPGDDCVVGKPSGNGVVCLYGRLGFGPTHFNEGSLEWHHFLGCDKECS